MKNFLFIVGCLFALAVGASFPLRATNAQFIDRITRPCATGAVLRALAITNPNNTGNIELTPCTGGSVTINGSAIVPGGATINPTNTFIPYRSNSTTFLDSPLARTSATVITSTAGLRFSTDNTLDIGATGALRPANGFFGTSLVSPLMVLTGATSGTLTLKVAAIAGTNTLTFPAGTTDFSATGGASQVVKQVTAGAAFTVARLACADLSDSGAGCTGSGATPGGASTQVQFNDAGAFGGDSGLTFIKATDVLTLAGNFIGAGTANRFGTATTNDAIADTMFSASATSTRGLVVQAKNTPTVAPFQVQRSDGTSFLQVQSDGGVIINQQTSATFVNQLDVKFQGTTFFSVSGSGISTALATSVGGFNAAGGNFTVTSTSGNITTLGTTSSKHYLGNGTSPTVAGDGTSNGSIAGKDAFSQVTVGTGTTTTITITFGTAYATAPVCVANAQTTVTPLRMATTTTTAVLTTTTAFTAGEVLHVVCGGF